MEDSRCAPTRGLSVAVGLSAVLALASCSSGTSPAGDPAGTAVPPLTDQRLSLEGETIDPVESAAPPLDFVMSSRADFQYSLDQALNNAVSVCAASIGISYTPPPAVRQVSVSPALGLLGLRDARQAAETGYLPIDLASSEADPILALPSEQRTALDRALFGEESTLRDISVENSDGQSLGGIRVGNGCLRSFYLEYFGGEVNFRDWLAADLILQDALQRSIAAAHGSEEHQNLVDEWSACMSDGGVLASDPFQLRTRDWPDPRPGVEELSTAGLDVACKDSLDFVNRATNALRGVQRDLVAAEGLDGLIASLSDLYSSPPKG